MMFAGTVIPASTPYLSASPNLTQVLRKNVGLPFLVTQLNLKLDQVDYI